MSFYAYPWEWEYAQATAYNAQSSWATLLGLSPYAQYRPLTPAELVQCQIQELRAKYAKRRLERA